MGVSEVGLFVVVCRPKKSYPIASLERVRPQPVPWGWPTRLTESDAELPHRLCDAGHTHHTRHSDWL
jgi:hypothetical protein